MTAQPRNPASMTDGAAGDEERLRSVLPLLESIAREVAERDASLDRVERALERLEQQNRERSLEAIQLIAEAAVHRRALRHAGAELARLGCTLLARRPPTIHIHGKRGQRDRGWIWLWRKTT